MPCGPVQRARIVLACTQRLTNSAIAKRLGTSPSTVGKWQRRFVEHGVQELHDELCPGRPRTHEDKKAAGLINRALQERPSHASAWSMRRMAEDEGVSKRTVQRWFSLFGAKPHRSDAFKHQGAVCRREEPGPGTQSQSAHVAAGTGLRRRLPP